MDFGDLEFEWEDECLYVDSLGGDLSDEREVIKGPRGFERQMHFLRRHEFK